MAWDALSRGKSDDAFVPVLLGDLNNHPDETVRISAAAALAQHVDHANVREALERAPDDPSIDVRREASEAVKRSGP